MFKKGEKVICLEPNFGLTAGKEYTVLRTEGEYTRVINDLGHEENFYTWRFELSIFALNFPDNYWEE